MEQVPPPPPMVAPPTNGMYANPAELVISQMQQEQQQPQPVTVTSSPQSVVTPVNQSQGKVSKPSAPHPTGKKSDPWGNKMTDEQGGVVSPVGDEVSVPRDRYARTSGGSGTGQYVPAKTGPTIATTSSGGSANEL